MLEWELLCHALNDCRETKVLFEMHTDALLCGNNP